MHQQLQPSKQDGEDAPGHAAAVALTCTFETYLPCCRRLSIDRICSVGRVEEACLVGKAWGRRQLAAACPPAASSSEGETRRQLWNPAFQSSLLYEIAWRDTGQARQPVDGLQSRSAVQTGWPRPHRVGRHILGILVDDRPSKGSSKHLNGLQACARPHLWAGRNSART